MVVRGSIVLAPRVYGFECAGLSVDVVMPPSPPSQLFHAVVGIVCMCFFPCARALRVCCVPRCHGASDAYAGPCGLHPGRRRHVWCPERRRRPAEEVLAVAVWACHRWLQPLVCCRPRVSVRRRCWWHLRPHRLLRPARHLRVLRGVLFPFHRAGCVGRVVPVCFPLPYLPSSRTFVLPQAVVAHARAHTHTRRLVHAACEVFLACPCTLIVVLCACPVTLCT